MKMMKDVLLDTVMIIISGFMIGAGLDLMINDTIVGLHCSILEGSVWGTIIVFGALFYAIAWGTEFHKDVNYLQEGQ